MKFRNLARSFAGLLFLAFTSFAQITAIEGVVKGTDGKPVQGAMIQIVRTDIKGNYKVKTDKKGHYIYNGLPLGTYDLSCEIDGKDVDKTSGVKTHPGDPIPVDFDLSKAAAQGGGGGSKQSAMQDALASGQISKDLERQLSPEQKKATRRADQETRRRHQEERRAERGLQRRQDRAGCRSVRCGGGKFQ